MPAAFADTIIGAKPLPGAEVILDGTRAMPDEKWIYWEGPGFKSAMPIIVDDPVDKGTAVMADDRVADGGNDDGKAITDTPGGLKLQCEGHEVRYRNAWIKELDLAKTDTDFAE